MVRGHTSLALDNEEGVGLDKDHVELVVVLGAGPCDTHADGYLLRGDETLEGVVDILLEPAAGEVVDFGGLEHLLLPGYKADGVEQLGEAGDGVAAVATAEGDVVDGHGFAHAAVDEAELLEGVESPVGQPTGAEAVEDAQGVLLAAGGTVAALLEVVSEAVETEILVEGHAVADGVDGVGTVVEGGVERGVDDEILACLHVKETGIELGEDVLDGEGKITGAAGQVDPVGDIGREPRGEAAADTLVDIAVLGTLEGDEVDLVVGEVEEGGIAAKELAVLAGGDKEQAVALGIILLEEEVGGQRLVGVEDVDKCFHLSISIHP